MAIAAIVLGAIGLIIAILPLASAAALFISWLAWLFAILGLIFGIIALAKGKKKPGLVGTILSVLTIVMYFVASNIAATRALNTINETFGKDVPGLQDALEKAQK